MSEKIQNDSKKEDVKCCGCSCSPTRLAQFLRHIAEFFDKKDK